MNTRSLLVLLAFLPALTLTAQAQVGIVGRIEGEEGTGEVSAAIAEADRLRQRDPAGALAALEALVERQPSSAAARYALGLELERRYDVETGKARAASLRERMLTTFREAAALGASDDAETAASAQARIAEHTEHTPISRVVRVQGAFLKEGSRGPAVRELQEILGVWRDGRFGSTTRAHLIVWQRARGLPGDGVVGPDTLTALEDPLARYRVLNTTYDAYRAGRNLGRVRVVRIDGSLVATETARAFLAMREAAKADGINLRIRSAFRSNSQQKYLYDLYKAGLGNLAAPPGYSHHQDGRALDLYVGAGSSEYAWLVERGPEFGFAQTVASEPWHWVLQR